MILRCTILVDTFQQLVNMLHLAGSLVSISNLEIWQICYRSETYLGYANALFNISYYLIFFSSFERLMLSTSSIKKAEKVKKLFDRYSSNHMHRSATL